MKTSDGSFHYCYNAQRVVDDAHQVIVATRLDNRSSDCPAFKDMLDEVISNCGRPPRQVLADAGYFSGDNLETSTTPCNGRAGVRTDRCRAGSQASPPPRTTCRRGRMEPPQHLPQPARAVRRERDRQGRSHLSCEGAEGGSTAPHGHIAAQIGDRYGQRASKVTRSPGRRC
jgi:hypothetical protein